MPRTILSIFCFLMGIFVMDHAGAGTGGPEGEKVNMPPPGKLDPDLIGIGYSGKEKLGYTISWTGGIKLGELYLEINSLPDVDGGFEIKASASTKKGAIHWVYPVEDLHVTKVKGLKKLPYHYEVWQKEGYGYRAHREIDYDQQKGSIRYLKNDQLEGEYDIDGETNNEFSSFLNSRLMNLSIGNQFTIPTFADKKREMVVVHVAARKDFQDTVLGAVTTVEVHPVLTFRGLYDKKGDTVIWYTDDECRVPVQIQSKIAIGSLTAKLKSYDNPGCSLYQATSR